MIRALLVVLLLNGDLLQSSTSNETFRASKNHRTTKRTIVSLIFANKTFQRAPIYEKNKSLACAWLRGFKKQNKQCRNRRGFAAVLKNARELAVSHCEDQFRYDRWNCGYKKSMFRKVYRETSFMYAISAAALMFSTAKACSEGKLQKCYCAEQPRYPRKGDWQWGGCGDNTKNARKIAGKFLRIDEEVNGPSDVLNYNTLVGFKAVKENEEKHCTCHGVTASCVIKTCWKVIKPFGHIAEDIKRKYRSATRMTIGNQIHTNSKSSRDRKLNKLVYLAQSPNFCDGTTGRRCKDHDHCATLCCGRGYDHGTITVSRMCGCRWHEKDFEVKCQTCMDEEDFFTCK